MATNYFRIDYHFEEVRSQVAIRKKKKISRPDVAFILIVSSLSPVEDSKAFKLFTVANLLYQLKW